jgi:hypothetical protein
MHDTNRDYGRGDPLRWPRDTLYQLKLAMYDTVPTNSDPEFRSSCNILHHNIYGTAPANLQKFKNKMLDDLHIVVLWFVISHSFVSEYRRLGEERYFKHKPNLRKIYVMLYLCLIKHYVMKAWGRWFHHSWPRHWIEGLDAPGRFTPDWNIHTIHWTGGTQNRSGHWRIKKASYRCLESNPYCSAHSPLLYRLSYPRVNWEISWAM